MDEFTIKNRLVVGDKGTWTNINEKIKVGVLSVLDPGDGFIKFLGSCEIGPGCLIDGAGGVEVGEGVKIGAGVKILSSEYIPGEQAAKDGRRSHARITIEPGCIIEPGAILLPGVILGSHSVVGPGALVSETLYPAESLIAAPVGMTVQPEKDEPDVDDEEEPDGDVPQLIGSDD